MQNIITIGPKHVPIEQIAYVDPFDPAANPEFKPEKSFKARVVLLNRETVLTESTPQEFAKPTGFGCFPKIMSGPIPPSHSGSRVLNLPKISLPLSLTRRDSSGAMRTETRKAGSCSRSPRWWSPSHCAANPNPVPIESRPAIRRSGARRVSGRLSVPTRR